MGESQSQVFPSDRRITQKAILRILGFVVSILLTLAGIMLMRGQELLAGVLVLGISLALLLISARSIEKHPLTDDEARALKPYLVPVLLFITSLVLTALVMFNITQFPRTTELNRMAAAGWLLSMISLSAGVLWVAHWQPKSWSEIVVWIKANRVELSLVAAIIIAGLIIRMVLLNDLPYPWSGDEASIGMEARRLLHGDNTDLFNTGWSGQPNVSFLPTAFSMLVFGENFFAIKMMAVITGTFSILALYLLAREWFSWEIALIAAGFLVAYPVHLQFSRMGVDNIFDALMIPLVLWLIYRAVRTQSLPTYLMAGIASGFTLYTYVGTRLVLAIGIGALVYIIITQKGYLKASLLHIVTYLAGFFVTAAPMLVFFVKNPQLFMTRIGQEGILLNGWLQRQVELTGLSASKILFQQFSHTVLVFFAENAAGNFLNFTRPYLTILGAIFFMIGLAVAFRHILDRRYFVLLAWFGSVLILGGFLTVNPPANTRLVMTIPAVCILLAVGVWQVSKILLQLKFVPGLVLVLEAVLVLILAIQNLSFYFGTYRVGYYFQDANGELAMEVGKKLQQLGTNYDYYLFGLPRVFAAFPTTDFLAPNNAKIDLQSDSITGLSLNPEHGAYIVATPDNEALLQQVTEKYPGGTWESIPRIVRDEVLYYAYTLAPISAGSP